MKHALIAALLWVGAASAAFAQVANNLSGNETWQAGQGPGGPGAYITADMVRNSAQVTTTSGSGAATSTGTGGTLIWTGTAPTTWAVTLPRNPPDGTIQRITTDTTLTTLVTVTAASGDTLVAAFASQTLTANTTVVAWQYNRPNTTWYRVQ